MLSRDSVGLPYAADDAIRGHQDVDLARAASGGLVDRVPLGEIIDDFNPSRRAACVGRQVVVLL